jgi:hypothetical protein
VAVAGKILQDPAKEQDLPMIHRLAALPLAVVLVSPAAMAGPRERHVLIAADAWLYAAPSENAAKVRLTGEHAPGALVPFRLVGEKKGWLTVETVEETDPAVDCYPAIAALADFKLRFAVRATDRSKVTGKALAHTFADGSQLALHAGVGLQPGAEGRVHIAVGGFSFEAALPPGAAGDSYRAEAIVPAEAYSRVLARGKPVTIDGRTVTVRGTPTAEDAGEGKVRLATRCAELVAQGKSVLPSMTGSGRGGSSPLPIDLVGIDRYVPAGKPVLFASGKPAGKTRRDVAAEGFTAQGSLLCQAIALAPAGGKAAADQSLTLCVRPGDVKADDSHGQVDSVLGDEK